VARGLWPELFNFLPKITPVSREGRARPTWVFLRSTDVMHNRQIPPNRKRVAGAETKGNYKPACQPASFLVQR
jgi:hypothetical protein